MKRIILKFIEYLNESELRKKASFLGKAQLCNGTSIRLMDGSDKADIIIGDNFRFFGGSIVSQNHGKIIIGKKVKLGNGTFIGSVESIKIGDGTSVADNVTIIDNNNHPVNPEDRRIMYNSPWDSELRRWKYSDSKAIVIGSNVWIGSNVRICKGVTIGENSVVAACTVVTKDVPVNSIVAGNPGKIVKTNIDLLPRKFK